MSEELCLAFIYTSYQFQVLCDARRALGKKESFYLIAPNGLVDKNELMEGDKLLEFYSKDRKTRFFEARALISEIKMIARSLPKAKYVFWLASDDHPVAQLLLCQLKIQSILLFEDGIGSYIEHSFMSWGRGFHSVLGKLKNFIFYMPYYRSSKSCGSVLADGYFAYSKWAFPSAVSAVTVISRSGDLSQCHPPKDFVGEKLILVLGQPLTFDLGVSSSAYFQNIRQAISMILENYCTDDQWNVIYKFHPRKDYSEDVIVEELSRLPGFKTLRCAESAEDIFSVCVGVAEIKVLSFVSTALLNIAVRFGSVDVFYIESDSVKVPKSYYDALKSVGVKKIKIF